MSLHVRRLTQGVGLTQDALSDLKKTVTENQYQTTKVVNSLREDIEQFKRHACREGMAKNAEATIATLHESISTLKAEMETMKAMMLQSTHSQ